MMDLSNKDVTVTDVRCPRESEHKNEASVLLSENVLLRERPDGTRFCPVHGEVERGPFADEWARERYEDVHEFGGRVF